MTTTYTIGDTVTIRHDGGTETGRIIGVQTDPTTGEVGWLRVEFADRTNSSWPVSAHCVPALPETTDV